jgi:hypothetical protein
MTKNKLLLPLWGWRVAFWGNQTRVACILNSDTQIKGQNDPAVQRARAKFYRTVMKVTSVSIPFSVRCSTT